jgi:ABC-2 type transport system ATP-binding protein
MDEAERCHQISYMANGTLLVRGTVDQVIRQGTLVTYAVSGGELSALAVKLASAAGIDAVAPFGASLHVYGRDADALEAAIAAYRDDPRLTWTRIASSLEDVFIELMSGARGRLQ